MIIKNNNSNNNNNNNNNGNFIEKFYANYNCKSHLTGNLQLANGT